MPLQKLHSVGGEIRTRLLILLFPLLASLAAAQSPATQDEKPDYSQEPYVIEKSFMKLTFEKDGTGTSEYSMRVKIQSEPAVRQFGLLRFQYQSAYENIDVTYVRVRKPDGTVIETPPQYFQDMPAQLTRTAPMYTDLRETHVAVKALAPGDVLEYQTFSRMHTPMVRRHFWFQYAFVRDAIMLEEELQVSVPRNQYVNVQSSDVEPTVTDVGKRRIYSWKTSNRERKDPAEKAASPPVGKSPPPPVQLTTFRSWEEVGRWYGELQRPRARPTPEIRAKAAELTRDAASDREKLRLLYHYVATQFRYISLSFGIGRYQPHPAAEVLGNQYGDCKDKHTLLASLAEAAGLKIYPALIHSTQALDSEIPSPGQFDHLISVIPQGDEFIWLDTTTEIAPFGLLTSNLRDKHALVIPDAGPATLVKIPATPPIEDFLLFQTEGKLSDTGTLDTDVHVTIRGEAEIALRAAFRQTPQRQWKDLVQSISYRWGFGGTVSNVTVSPPEATNAPFKLTYHYQRETYSDWENHRVLLPLPPMRLPAPPEEDTPDQPLALGGPAEIHLQAQMELPSGLTPKIPSPQDLQTEFADYRATYRLADGVLHADRHLHLRVRELPSSRMEEYKPFQQAVRDDYLSPINFRDEAETESIGSENPEAVELYEQGIEADRQRNSREAVDLFKQAVSLDPTFGAAWLEGGLSQMEIGEFDQGIASLRKALELNPKLSLAYKALAFALAAMQRTEEVIQTWRDLQKVHPQDRDAAANLGSLLIGLGRHAEAVPELETAVKLNPASSHLNFDLGQAYLRSGDEELALAALEKAAELDPAPRMWNNIAYELAEHSHRFASALDYAQKAVAAHEEETAGLALEALKTTDLRLIQELGGEWDTLGWVHFHLGNLGQAEKYLYAAWLLSQDPVMADHLGQLYEKQQKKKSAAQAYAWALAASRPDPQIRERLRRLLGSETKTDRAVSKAREELGRMRTVKLDHRTPKKATAEFFLLFAPGPTVEEVKFISGAEELRQAADALTAANYNVSFPDDGPTRLLRRGILVCAGGASPCEFVLFTTDSVRSLD